jgi:hypothetical protein
VELVKRAAMLLMLTACMSVMDGSREEFSRQLTCPLERVEARARPELHVSDLREERSTPPKDVAADPERMKMWQQKQDEDRKWRDNRDEIFEVRGCGHQLLMACHRYNKGQGGFVCTKYDYPANVARW